MENSLEKYPLAPNVVEVNSDSTDKKELMLALATWKIPILSIAVQLLFLIRSKDFNGSNDENFDNSNKFLYSKFF